MFHENHMSYVVFLMTSLTLFRLSVPIDDMNIFFQIHMRKNKFKEHHKITLCYTICPTISNNSG